MIVSIEEIIFVNGMLWSITSMRRLAVFVACLRLINWVWNEKYFIYANLRKLHKSAKLWFNMKTRLKQLMPSLLFLFNCS